MKPLAYRKVIKKSRKAEFILRRKTCVIPHHKEIKGGTLKSIIKQMGITEEEFIKL